MYYWNNKAKSVLCCFLFCIIGTGLLYAQHKKIQVEFQVLESEYKLFYGDSIPDLHSKGKVMIAQRLQEKFPFVKFATQAADYQLIINIDRQHTGLNNPLIQQVDVVMQMVSSDGTVSDTIAFEFRNEDRFLEPLPPSNEAFLSELDDVLDYWLGKELEKIIRSVMSHVSLGEKAHPDTVNQSWVMPFSPDSLKIGNDSEFIVKSKLQTADRTEKIDYEAIAKGRINQDTDNYPKEYWGKIFARIKPDGFYNTNVDVMGQAEIQGIHLTKYIRPALSNPYSPSDFNIIEN